MPILKSKSTSRISFRVSSRLSSCSLGFPEKVLVIVLQDCSSLPSLCNTVSTPMNSCSFAQKVASIIIALLCLAKNSLLDKTVHPATTFVLHSTFYFQSVLRSPSRILFSPSVPALT